HVVVAAHATINELNNHFLADAFQIPIAPVFKRIGRSLATRPNFPHSGHVSVSIPAIEYPHHTHSPAALRRARSTPAAWKCCTTSMHAAPITASVPVIHCPVVKCSLNSSIETSDTMIGCN